MSTRLSSLVLWLATVKPFRHHQFMNITQALAGSDQLKATSESPAVDVELLLCHAIDHSRTFLFTRPEYELTAEQQQLFDALLIRRKAGEPVAHLTGSRGFWTLDLEVNATTLIPRPDTECLVEKALELLTESRARVIDLGTGSGAIALALASERPGWQVIGVDRVADAVRLAEKNRCQLGLDNVEILQGSWLEPVTGKFDMIVSNPPYIDPQDPHLSQGDVRFEPLSALVADEAGLADIREIAKQAGQRLKVGGWLVFEHGYEQAETVRNLITELGYRCVDSAQDLAGNDRITWGAWMQEIDSAER
ncbi:MAG: peptide chain release factor N(5)-glutamine methyltransferase [Amphritea sp.]